MTSGSQELSAGRHILVLANPKSGGFRRDTLDRLTRDLRDNGNDVDLRLSRRAGDFQMTCADPALSADVLVLAGGDGSVNEAVTGFHSRATPPPPLAVVPFGTANVLAHELNLPRNPEAIADMIRKDRRQHLYTGLANGKPFVMMVSAGFDAAVVHGVSPRLKRHFGKFAYVIAALRAAFRPHRPNIEVDDGLSVQQCRLAVVTNGSRYGGPFVICPDAHVTEPGLYLLMFESVNPLSLAWLGMNLLSGRIHKVKSTRIIRVDRINMTAAKPVPVQIDGDPFGTLPLAVECGHRPVSILVP